LYFMDLSLLRFGLLLNDIPLRKAKDLVLRLFFIAVVYHCSAARDHSTTRVRRAYLYFQTLYIISHTIYTQDRLQPTTTHLLHHSLINGSSHERYISSQFFLRRLIGSMPLSKNASPYVSPTAIRYRQSPIAGWCL